MDGHSTGLVLSMNSKFGTYMDLLVTTALRAEIHATPSLDYGLAVGAK